MRSNTKLKLAGMMLGAALTSTTAVAASSGSCGAGKCGGDMKKVEKKAHAVLVNVELICKKR